MPRISALGGMSSRGFGQFSGQQKAKYVEEVFNTTIYAGTGASQNIVNDIDLSSNEGMVWIKGRSTLTSNFLFDTIRGPLVEINSDTNAQDTNLADSLTSFNADGFTIGGAKGIGVNTAQYVSYTFRKAPKFFDIVTYTGTGSLQNIAHNLESPPYFMFIKARNSTQNWAVYYDVATRYLTLNSTAASLADATYWNNTAPTSSVFTVNTNATVNSNGVEYVAYLFASGYTNGFGEDGTERIIYCGSYTGNGSSTIGPIINDPGFEPQFVLIKNSGATGNWVVIDNVRGMYYYGNGAAFLANTTVAETISQYIAPRSDGFQVTTTAADINTNGNIYTYMAIRRGPMKTPTDATKVFQPVVYTGTNVDNRLVTTNILNDMVLVRQRNDTVLGGMVVGDRLRGVPYMLTGTTAVESATTDGFMTPTVGYGGPFSTMQGFGVGNNVTPKLNVNTTTNNHVAEAFKCAPLFFDMVAYTGTGSTLAVPHNLGQTPGLTIIKRRNTTTGNWRVATTAGFAYQLVLNTTAAYADPGANAIGISNIDLQLETGADVNTSGSYYVAYLFGTCPGVSSVGNYTGSGTTQQIDCGFTSGSRFVLIKRTDTTGDWYVWDSARGIVAGNDPYLLLNSTAAEVTSTDYVDTYSAGFELSSTAPAGLNERPGITWTARTSGFGTNIIYTVAALNNRWIIGGANGTLAYNAAVGRTDGWQVVTSTFGTSIIRSAAYGNGVYVIVGDGGKIATSTNLTSWTARTSGVTSILLGVAYGNGKFIAVGQSGVMRSSTDGITWSAVTNPFGTSVIYDVIYAGGQFIAVGASGLLATSSDGVTWTTQTSGFGANAIYTITYGNGLYVIGGGAGTLATSPDGITWTLRTSGFGANIIYGAAYGSGLYALCGAGGILRTSPDGITWTTRTTTFSTNTIQDVGSDGETFVAVGASGTLNNSFPNYIYLAIA